MPNINDRIGSQNVIRVLSNASAPPTKLINLTDVNASNTTDGVILVWDLPSESFIMTSVVDRNLSINDTTVSISTSTGAFTVKGGVGIGQNLNIGGNLKVVGIATFGTGTVIIDGDNDSIKVGAALTIDAQDGIFTPSINIGGLVNAEKLYISGITTLAATSGITTTGGDFYSGANAFVGGNLRVQGSSNFIGTATFHGGTINLGDSDTDDINVVGEFISNLIPNVDATYDIGMGGKRWRNAKFSGLINAGTLDVVGVSSLNGNTNIVGFVSVTEGLYYDTGDFDGPNGIAYFDNFGKLIGAASTESYVTTTNYVLSTNSSGIPVWSSVIDGGEY